MVKPLEKEDRKFLLNLNLLNRDYLTNNAMFIFNTTIAYTAIYLSIYSLLFPFLVTPQKISVGLILLVLLIIYWTWSIKKYRWAIKYSKKFNKQYQEHYFKMYPKKEYPELSKKIF